MERRKAILPPLLHPFPIMKCVINGSSGLVVKYRLFLGFPKNFQYYRQRKRYSKHDNVPIYPQLELCECVVVVW